METLNKSYWCNKTNQLTGTILSMVCLFKKKVKRGYFLWNCQEMHQWPLTLWGTRNLIQFKWSFLRSMKDLHFPCCCLHPTDYHLIEITFLPLGPHGLPEVIPTHSCSTIKETLENLKGFWRGIHSNHTHVMRNDLICFIEEGLFWLYNGRKTNAIWNYIFQWGQSSIVAIGPDGLCLVNICIYKKTQLFSLKMTWRKIGPSKNCHISPSYTTGHSVSNDTKYSVIYSTKNIVEIQTLYIYHKCISIAIIGSKYNKLKHLINPICPSTLGGFFRKNCKKLKWWIYSLSSWSVSKSKLLGIKTMMVRDDSYNSNRNLILIHNKNKIDFSTIWGQNFHKRPLWAFSTRYLECGNISRVPR